MGRQRMTCWMHHWLNGHEFEQNPEDGDSREPWHAAVHGVTKSQIVHNLVTEQQQQFLFCIFLLLLLSHFSPVRLCVTHRWQTTRRPHPWDYPRKNTGVACHFFLQCMKMKSESKAAQSYLTCSDPMDCSLAGSSVHGIFQARVLSGLPLPSPCIFLHPSYSFSR